MLYNGDPRSGERESIPTMAEVAQCVFNAKPLYSDGTTIGDPRSSQYVVAIPMCEEYYPTGERESLFFGKLVVLRGTRSDNIDSRTIVEHSGRARVQSLMPWGDGKRYVQVGHYPDYLYYILQDPFTNYTCLEIVTKNLDPTGNNCHSLEATLTTQMPVGSCNDTSNTYVLRAILIGGVCGVPELYRQAPNAQSRTWIEVDEAITAEALFQRSHQRVVDPQEMDQVLRAMYRVALPIAERLPGSRDIARVKSQLPN